MPGIHDSAESKKGCPGPQARDVRPLSEVLEGALFACSDQLHVRVELVASHNKPPFTGCAGWHGARAYTRLRDFSILGFELRWCGRAKRRPDTVTP